MASDTVTSPTTTQPADGDWADQVTDLIVDTIDRVRDRTVVPARVAARYAIYGTVALLLAIPLVVVLLIMLVRLLDAFLPSGVWVPDLILGVVFVVGGLFLWSKRSA